MNFFLKENNQIIIYLPG